MTANMHMKQFKCQQLNQIGEGSQRAEEKKEESIKDNIMSVLQKGVKDLVLAAEFAQDLDYYGSLDHFYNVEQEMQLQTDAIIRGHMETQFAMLRIAQENQELKK